MTGLVLALAAIWLTPGAASWLAARVGLALQLDGPQSAARIWLLKIILGVMSLPLLLLRFSRHPKLRPLFDAALGLALLVVLLLLLEGVFSWLNRRPAAATEPGTATQFSQPYVEPDDALGYILKPSVRVTATQTSGSRVIYQVEYATDANRRRLTPVSNPGQRDTFALFFGDSFTFGDGLANNQTLPAAVGQLAPKVMPYNYGVSGYGPQHMLAQLQNRNLRAEVSQPQGVAVYTFICSHINRAIGSMEVHNTWGASMPYYALNPDGQLERRGNFVSGRPVLAVVYAVLGLSQTARYFNLQLPRLTDDHYELTARILAAAAHQFEAQFGPGNPVYVLIYPDQQGCTGQLLPQFDKLGLKYLDYSRLFTRAQADLWQPDGHPSPRAQQLVAEKLAQDLHWLPAGATSP